MPTNHDATLLESQSAEVQSVTPAVQNETAVVADATSRAYQPPIYSYRYLGNYPKDRETGWSDNMQGVTHDENNWYFTQTAKLWKFPVGHDLNKKVTKADPARGILQVGIPEQMRRLGYNHFGDFGCAIHKLIYHPTKRFLFIATEGKKDERPIPPAIAVFRGKDLSFVGFFPIPNQTRFPFCAYNPADNLLYCYMTDEQRLRLYKPDFLKLRQDEVHFTHVRSHTLKDRAGNPLDFPFPQGGCFSPDGRIFFAINGYYKEADRHTTGIHVFDTSFRRQTRSTNGYGTFNYEYHPGYTSNADEPEGITYWDLRDGRAPGMRGVLHAIMNDQDFWTSDDLYFKHYDEDSRR